MKRSLLLALVSMPFALAAFAGVTDGRFVKNYPLPNSPAIAVIAEGDFEPRSVGSYSLRIYAGVNPGLPFDNFVTGMVRARDGAVEGLLFHDFDGDGAAEIVVVTRSAGSGSYLSADAFAFRGEMLLFLDSACGLPADADPVAALAKKIK